MFQAQFLDLKHNIVNEYNPIMSIFVLIYLQKHYRPRQNYTAGDGGGKTLSKSNYVVNV